MHFIFVAYKKTNPLSPVSAHPLLPWYLCSWWFFYRADQAVAQGLMITHIIGLLG